MRILYNQRSVVYSCLIKGLKKNMNNYCWHKNKHTNIFFRKHTYLGNHIIINYLVITDMVVTLFNHDIDYCYFVQNSFNTVHRLYQYYQLRHVHVGGR